MRKHLLQIALGLALTLFFLGHAAKVYQIPLLSTLEAFAYDARLRMSMQGGIDERIVILDIDERSLTEVGRWPWNRRIMADLTNKLFDDFQIRLLGFDVIFAEADTSSGLQSLEKLASVELKNDAQFQVALKGLQPTLDFDRRFSEAIRDRAVVLAYSFTNHEVAHKGGQLPEPLIAPKDFRDTQTVFTHWNGYGANLPTFQRVAASAGHINPLIDFDGVSRRVPMLVEHEGQHYAALSLAMMRVLLSSQVVLTGYPGSDDAGGRGSGAIEWLDVLSERGNVRVPLDEQAATLIPYRGLQGSFRYLSATDVLNGKVSKEQLKGKIVLMGTSAPGLVDLRSTPAGASYPGVEVHANMLAGLLDGSVKAKPGYLVGAESVLLVICALISVFLLPILSPLRATMLTLSLLLMVLGLNFFLWESGIVMPLAATVVVILGLYAPNMAWGYFSESRSKYQFAELFGQYVPSELVNQMARDPERYSMEGKAEELTVLFSDVRGFTSISEAMPPKELANLMNEYLGSMTEVVQRHRGTLDKYIGDAIMAFWGAPVADVQHAHHAVVAALEMQRQLRKLDPLFRSHGWPLLQIGVSVNTGVMTVGDMGSPVRKAYTVMGDAVNLGARLEGVTKQYGVGIIVSETTKALVQGIVYRELDRVRVKGKDQPVSIFEPLGTPDELDNKVLAELETWDLTLRLFRVQDWTECEQRLQTLINAAPECLLYKVYLQRVTDFITNPPMQPWDGVTTLVVK